MAFNEKEDTFTPDFLEEIQEVKFEPIKVAWINDPQISQDIGIET